MMTTCPKCGFEQPKDRFCANCGLDIQSFVPSKPSLFKRISGNTGFYIAALVFIVGFCTLLIVRNSQQKNMQLAEIAANQKSSPMDKNAGFNGAGSAEDTSRDAENPENIQVPTAEAVINFAEPDESETPADESALTLAQPSGTPAPAPGESADPVRPNNLSATAANTRQKSRSEIEVLFVKIDQGFADTFTTDAEARLLIGAPSAGVISQYKTRLESGQRQNMIETLATEVRTLATNQAAVIFQGGRDQKTGESIGFFVDISSHRQTDRGAEIKVNIRRVAPEMGPDGQRTAITNLDETFVVPAGSAAFMGGLLPRSVSSENPEQFSTIPVFRPLLDDRFRRNASEFVILLAPSLTETTPVQ